MKITIPTPCSEKLNDVNFCSKCQHQIIDFSELEDQTVSKEFEKNKVYCGIFSPNQLGRNIVSKTISNIAVFSAIGLIGTTANAQEKITCTETPQPKNETIQNETVEFKIIVNKSDAKDSYSSITSYRLLVNNEIIEENIEVGKEYTIKFEHPKNSHLNVRLASNQNQYQLSRNYTSDNLPKEIKLQLSDFRLQPIIMGKIAVKR